MNDELVRILEGIQIVLRGRIYAVDANAARELLNSALTLARQGAEDTRQWLPIDSVPKDGREVLLRVKLRAGIPDGALVGHYMRGGHCIEDHPAIDAGWYFWNGYMFDKAAEPTHWMALPVEASR